MNPDRRPLEFASLFDVMPDVDRLLEGHDTVGRWSLGQICNHLSTAIVGSVDGYAGAAPWPVRATLGRFFKGRILGTGRMREGVGLPERFVPKPGLDGRAEAEALRAAISAYSAHRGAFAPHPFFGPMTPEDWTLLHRIHCAHHLSFARPAQVGAGSAA